MNKNFYLKHSLMAMHDPRMKNLVEKEGFRGSGAYWFILEKLSLLPEPCARPEYLRPFCTSKKISWAYLKKIIFEYQLFSIDEDGFFMPEELNPPRKKERKMEKNTQENEDSKTKNSDIRQKMSENKSENKLEKSDKRLKINNLSNESVDSTKENIKDKITTAATEEKEETAAADDFLSKISGGAGRRLLVLPAAPVCEYENFGRMQSGHRNCGFMAQVPGITGFRGEKRLSG